MNPEVLYEDPHLIVINKPSGLLSQSDISGDRSLVDWAREHVGRHYIGLVHRLDRNTSGLMVLGKRSKAADRLSESLRVGKITRDYMALLHGNIQKADHWEDWLLKNESTNEVRIVKPETSKSKIAKLAIVPLKTYRKKEHTISLAQFHLDTGRSHQIRVQAASRGYPLVGDSKYGAPQFSHSCRLALHSYLLEFPHPMTQETMRFESPLPKDLELWLQNG